MLLLVRCVSNAFKIFERALDHLDYTHINCWIQQDKIYSRGVYNYMENSILKSAQFAINYIVVPIHSKGVYVYMCWAMFPVYSQMVALQLLRVAFHYRCMNLTPCIQSCRFSIIWFPPISTY